MKKKNDILISVVVPFFDYIDWLVEALESVESQTFKHIEVIVINDGSKYDLQKILYDHKFEMPVKIINKENGGPSSARNKGIMESKGKYIAFLDSDDIWFETKLQTQFDLMEKNKSKWSQHSYYYLYDNNNIKFINTSFYPKDCYLDTFISFKVQTSSIMVRKDALIEGNKLVIYFPENIRYGEDLIFYRNLAQKYSLLSIPIPLHKFRIRGNNAGFQPSIQLSNKSDTWDIIKKNKNEHLFPKSVKIAYQLSWIGEKIYNKFPSSFRSKYLSNICYLPSYTLFKFCSFKRGKK